MSKEMAELLEQLYLLDHIYMHHADEALKCGDTARSQMYAEFSGNLGNLWREHIDDRNL